MGNKLEDNVCLLARNLLYLGEYPNGHRFPKPIDSKNYLLYLGFNILDIDDDTRFYRVEVPQGYSKKIECGIAEQLDFIRDEK